MDWLANEMVSLGFYFEILRWVLPRTCAETAGEVSVFRVIIPIEEISMAFVESDYGLGL